MPSNSDSTPSVTYQLNRLGQVEEVSDGSGTRELKYTDRGKLNGEEYVSGPLAGRGVEHTYHPDIDRLTSIKVVDGTTVLHTQSYGYHMTNNRLETVSEGNFSIDYWYGGQTYRVVRKSFQRGSTFVEESGRHLDRLNRYIHSYLGPDWLTSNAPLLHEYDYNAANQRVGIERQGVDEPIWRWDYVYDSLGQVTSAQRHWGELGGTSDPVQGQQYTYLFDDIGNRTQTTTNGETVNYTLATGSSAGLNQYAERDVPDVIDVLGFSLYPAGQSTLEVNGVTADHRKQSYFYHQLGNLGNSSSDLFEEVEVIEYYLGNPVAEDSGYYFVAEDPEVFDYDDDGNLLSDGRWEYRWDAENRLIEVEEIRTAEIQQVRRRKLTIIYDDQGRKVRTQQVLWHPGRQVWGNSTNRHYVYSGFNIIGEGYVNPNSSGNWNIETTYLWGLDEVEMNDYRVTNNWSSIGHSSGGVGGLLLISDHDLNEAHFVHSDGNGSVVALIDADGNGEISAMYDYDPFGNLIRASGEAAELNPFRFSTKYHHEFYGLSYYGFRFYSPGQGRFLNRDPIGERGGLNLYAFVGNDPVNRWDWLGLSSSAFTPDRWVKIQWFPGIEKALRLDLQIKERHAGSQRWNRIGRQRLAAARGQGITGGLRGAGHIGVQAAVTLVYNRIQSRLSERMESVGYCHRINLHYSAFRHQDAGQLPLGASDIPGSPYGEQWVSFGRSFTLPEEFGGRVDGRNIDILGRGEVEATPKLHYRICSDNPCQFESWYWRPLGSVDEFFEAMTSEGNVEDLWDKVYVHSCDAASKSNEFCANVGCK